MRHVRLLLAIQWCSLRNAFSRATRGDIAARLFAGAALCGAAIASGILAVPSASTGTPDPATSPPLVELGFWLGAFGAGVLSFRVMENIYRAQDTRLLATWPVPLAAQFWYRLLRSGIEVGALFFLSCLFLAPALASHPPGEVLAAVLLVGGGLVFGLSVGFVVQLRAGVASFVRKGSATAMDGGLARMDAGGGTAAAFYMSPGAALVATLTGLLLVKLSVIDEFFLRGTTTLFWIGVGVPTLLSVISVVLARRDFVRFYPILLARFYEADLIQFDSGYNYHESALGGRRGILENLVSSKLVPFVRKDVLQLSRRYPLMRLAVAGLWIAVGIAAWGDRLPPLTLGLVPVCYLCILAAPWARLYSTDLEPGILRTAPVASRTVHTSKLVVSLREALIAGGPCAILIGALGAPPLSLAGSAIALFGTAIAALILTPLARSVGPSVTRLIGLAGCAAVVPLF
jgi:hypothetical protein